MTCDDINDQSVNIALLGVTDWCMMSSLHYASASSVTSDIRFSPSRHLWFGCLLVLVHGPVGLELPLWVGLSGSVSRSRSAFHPSLRLPVAIRFPLPHPGVASLAETVSPAAFPQPGPHPKPAGINDTGFLSPPLHARRHLAW
ncbi:hypothetical protein BDZ89DRAFT_225279 [Hymenopellis radicata]|nr:hypothetical protein BDZ89DRAFT_225279 [Hymenopellis radicata]